MNRQFVINDNEKKVIKNFIYLSISQASNLIIPIVFSIYLIKVLGIENFGKLSVSFTLMTYFRVLIDYGFSQSSIKKIALIKEDNHELEKTVSNVFFTKAFLTLLALIILITLLFFVEDLKYEKLLFLFSFPLVIGQLFTLNWYFQGIEKVSLLARSNVISKVLAAFLILCLITQKKDYIFVNLILGITDTLVGISTILTTKLKIRVPSIKSILYSLNDSFILFLSNICVILSINSNIIILKLFSNYTTVGNYSAAEKVFMIFRSLVATVSFAIYPRIANLLESKNVEETKNLLRKMIILSSVIFFSIGIITFLFSDMIIYYTTHQYIKESIETLKILSFAPIIATFSIIPTQILFVKGREISYLKMAFLAVIVNLTLNALLIPYYGEVGCAITALCTELFFVLALSIKIEVSHKDLSIFSLFRTIESKAE